MPLSCSLGLDGSQAWIIERGNWLAAEALIEIDTKWRGFNMLEGRSIQSIKSGEGWVFHFTGPGDIMVQNRNQQQLIAWINTEIGSRE